MPSCSPDLLELLSSDTNDLRSGEARRIVRPSSLRLHHSFFDDFPRCCRAVAVVSSESMGFSSHFPLFTFHFRLLTGSPL